MDSNNLQEGNLSIAASVLSNYENISTYDTAKYFLQRFVLPGYKTGLHARVITYNKSNKNKNKQIISLLIYFCHYSDMKQEILIANTGGIVLRRLYQNPSSTLRDIEEEKLSLTQQLLSSHENRYLCLAYEKLRLAMHIQKMDNKEFSQKFVISNIKYKQFTEIAGDKRLRDELQVQYKLLSLINSLSAEIWLQFMQFFNIYDLSDEICKNMLLSSVLKPQMLHSVENFAMLSEVGSNKVFKTVISDEQEGKQQQNDFLQKIFFNNTNQIQIERNNIQNNIMQVQKQWDIQIIGFPCPFIGDMKIRSLSYFRSIMSDDINIKLSYPQNIISLSLSRVNIENIQECTQMRNLFTRRCNYAEGQLCNINTIQHFISQEDSYKGQNFIYEVFKYSKPTYIEVIQGINMIDNVILNQNIENLQFFNVYNTKQEENVIININSCYPKLLQVFHVQNYKTHFFKCKHTSIEQIKQFDWQKRKSQSSLEESKSFKDDDNYICYCNEDLTATIIGKKQNLMRLFKQLILFQPDMPTPSMTPEKVT